MANIGVRPFNEGGEFIGVAPILVFGILGVVLILLVVMLVFMMTRKGKTTIHRGAKGHLIPTSVWLTWFKRLYNNPFTRQGLLRVHTSVAELSIFTDIEARVTSLKVYLTGILIFIAVIIASAFLLKDAFFVLICILYAMVMREVVVNKKLDKYHSKLYLQLSDAISSLRQEYIRLRSVTEALAACECGSLVQRPINEIHSILSSYNVQENLEAFYNSSPLKVIQTLAGVCYAINRTGDAVLSDGSSNFVSSLSLISNEVNLEIRRLRLQKSQFGSLELLPVLPVLALGPIKSFFINTIPGTAVIYNGMLGYLITILIIICSIAAFKIITSITRPVAIKYDDRSDFDRKLLSKKKIRMLVKLIEPVKLKSLNKKFTLLKKSMTRLNLDYLYLRKTYFLIFTFFALLLVVFISLSLGKDFARNNVMEASLMSAAELSKAEIDLLRAMDETYLASQSMSEDEMRALIKTTMPGIRDYEMEAQVKRLYDKANTLDNLKFHFWILWICLFFAFIAWHVPEIILKVRTWLIKTESEEDCLQLQTVIGILMNTPIDTLDLLDWMSKHSRVFKPILVDAYQDYPSDAYQSLSILKMRAGISEFRRIVDKLTLTVSQITIAEAFSDIIIERDHLLRMREIAQTESIMKKRAMMSPVAMSTLALTIALYFILPIGVLGARQLIDLLTNSSFL